MRKLLILSSLYLLCAVMPAQADSIVTIDFDDRSGMTFISGSPVPSNAVLTDQYAGLGVRFQNTAVVELGVGHAVTGANGIGGISPFGTLTYSSHYPQIQFSFFDKVTPAVSDFVSIQGDLIGNSSQSQTLSAYDLQGNLVGSATVFDSGGQTYAIHASGIHSVKWSGVDINDDEVGGVALDHLTFDQPVAVPEPSTLLLAGSGGWMALLLAMVKARSRRRDQDPCRK